MYIRVRVRPSVFKTCSAVEMWDESIFPGYFECTVNRIEETIGHEKASSIKEGSVGKHQITSRVACTASAGLIFVPEAEQQSNRLF
jgi:hypothetical protein